MWVRNYSVTDKLCKVDWGCPGRKSFAQTYSGGRSLLSAQQTLVLMVNVFCSTAELKENAAVGEPCWRSPACTSAEVPQCFLLVLLSKFTILFCLTKIIFFSVVTSLNSAAYDPLVILDTICRVKVGECLLLDETRSSFIAHQPSEQGYLNLTSPSASSVTAAPQEGADEHEQVWGAEWFGLMGNQLQALSSVESRESSKGCG